ncbi:hypothetical protein Val02_65940 [Virgisporangium aliadipatigenens]|uniref:Ribonuclease E n=1 Tax=Virgisporangium aliadipatigenens TaxID=741659 RepID=A0A8J4DU50_9ACTN|nr:Rne/Rng family ribonuclease [Virgisporangium aliadipatigenens]GIJ49708.1 hypothetical protein Val02_65940 [Virgisporangium aliadipatigenens]
MLDNELSGHPGGAQAQPEADTNSESITDPALTTEPVRRTRRRAVKATEPTGDPAAEPSGEAVAPAPRTRRRATKATAAVAEPVPFADATGESGVSVADGVIEQVPADLPEPAPTRTRRRRTKAEVVEVAPVEEPVAEIVEPADPDAVLDEEEETEAGADAPAVGATTPAGVTGAAVPAVGRARVVTGGAAPVTDATSGPIAPAPTASTSTDSTSSDSAPAGAVAVGAAGEAGQGEAPAAPTTGRRRRAVATTVLFMAPTEAEVEAARVADRARAEAAQPAAEASDVPPETAEEPTTRSRRRRGKRTAEPEPEVVEEAEPEAVEADADEDDDEDENGNRRRRRRGRRGRGRGRGGIDDESEEPAAAEAEEPEAADGDDEEDDESGEQLTRRRRRRRRKGAADSEPADAEPGVVVKIREPRAARDEVQGVSGSTRLEAKRQRRRDGREQRRTRPPILSEAEFLARREAVDREMVIRQKGDRTQIAVLEDDILVEHYVTRASAATMVGNVYLGRVQNVLPSMEAAFVDIGRGRNAVLYAGEVNWDATGLEGRTRTIEQALKSGDPVLVQVTKDPIGTKGARLTSHIALSGRHLVYVPHGNASGISRKLSDVERKRLRDILKNLVPDGAGVIVRTAAEGASEDELERDVTRLQAQWEEIHKRSQSASAPSLLYEEPDLAIRVVRDLFNEDFRDLVVQGERAYEMVAPYLEHVSPDLVERLRRHTGVNDVFAEKRIDEQLMKALDRKVFLPSGGSLVIDRTEAMTVIDVNTGKYTGAGGNLEETVTRNNLEAAEEIVRQLRLRDLGGIIVIDFIDMVLESNRDLVLRRLTECLGRDRTKHQVTEITSLGLVQMTRKRVGQGLLEAFSETCEHCKGRGLIIHPEPVGDRRPAQPAQQPSARGGESDEGGRSGRRRGRRGSGGPAVAVEDEAETENEDVEVITDAVVGDGEPAEPDDVDADPVTAADTDEYDGDAPETGGELRRRTRRGGVRRRTRP